MSKEEILKKDVSMEVQRTSKGRSPVNKGRFNSVDQTEPSYRL